MRDVVGSAHDCSKAQFLDDSHASLLGVPAKSYEESGKDEHGLNST